MGHHLQTVVDLSVSAAAAEAVAARGLRWLVAEGIVLAERTDCVLGVPLGHPPGPEWGRAVAAGEGEPYGGLRVTTGRVGFDAGQYPPAYAQCPHCASRIALYTEDWDVIPGAWLPFDAAMDRWYESGAAAVVCPDCGRAGDLTAWTWDHDRYAFGYLGFAFRDWPRFSPQFLAAFGDALGGHRVVVVGGAVTGRVRGLNSLVR
ncbi:hypothetical protein [Yinghuangia soli]|uniref:Uncharacterized protein n=1 Tax=Yinghuangia soli TaxID=2908204 RepID=A0AA41PYB3_9ACTN|nr:hypothetical protein [Yinghuangia soli]MCF2527842.1 hypothetical protein [Yinghuangia soli]